MKKKIRLKGGRAHRAAFTSISLFTGAGGLDLGLERARFEVRLCVEIDEVCRKTLKANRPKWQLSEPSDVHSLLASSALEQAGLRPRQLTLLAGGPPCQPFSKSAYWARGDTARLRDHRAKALDAYLRLLEHALPRVILLENVKGLVYEGKDEGLRLLRAGLERVNSRKGTRYAPQVLHVKATDYGVPQLRERVFILAERDGRQLEMPKPTHGPQSANGEPYRSAWDAIGDLDIDIWPTELNATGAWARLLPSIPEGENYLWHTPKGGGLPLFGWRTRYWSFLLKLSKEQPAWTIQAAPGPATGPFHWRSRKLSIRELCRLQTFPDDYEILGTYREAFRQVGNAVPPALGQLLGLEIRRQLLGERVRISSTFIPTRRAACPPPERRRPVPREYLRLQRNHADHPGVGLGPGAQRRAA